MSPNSFIEFEFPNKRHSHITFRFKEHPLQYGTVSLPNKTKQKLLKPIKLLRKENFFIKMIICLHRGFRVNII